MKTKITIGVFILMLVLCAVALALPADEQSVLNENRIPAQMPEMSLQNVFFGTFCEDFRFVGGFYGLLNIGTGKNTIKAIPY